MLALITGSPYFPGGFHNHVVAADSMQIDLGPSAPVDLQWATYYDAADQAGQSRRYGGIHPPEDDFPARIVGSQAGSGAFTLAEKYWTGGILTEKVVPAMIIEPGTGITMTTAARRGRHRRCRKSHRQYRQLRHPRLWQFPLHRRRLQKFRCGWHRHPQRSGSHPSNRRSARRHPYRGSQRLFRKLR